MQTIFELIRLFFKQIFQLLSRKHVYRKRHEFYNREEWCIRYRHHPKPPWAKDKILYLKAHLPNYGCRKIAMTFNRIYADKNVSVSKSTVYSLIKNIITKLIKFCISSETYCSLA